MQVYGPTHVHGPQAVGAPHTTRATRSTSPVESPKIQDEVNISDAARLVEQAKQAPDIRQDRVQAIRARLPPAPTRRPASSRWPSTTCWTKLGDARPFSRLGFFRRQRQEFRGTHEMNSSEGIQNQSVSIVGNQVCRPTGNRDFPENVVIRVSTGLNRIRRA